MLSELIYFSYSLRVMVSFSAGLIDSMPQIGSLKGDHGKTVAGKRADFSAAAVQGIVGCG